MTENYNWKTHPASSTENYFSLMKFDFSRDEKNWQSNQKVRIYFLFFKYEQLCLEQLKQKLDEIKLFQRFVKQKVFGFFNNQPYLWIVWNPVWVQGQDGSGSYPGLSLRLGRKFWSLRYSVDGTNTPVRAYHLHSHMNYPTLIGLAELNA